VKESADKPAKSTKAAAKKAPRKKPDAGKPDSAKAETKSKAESKGSSDGKDSRTAAKKKEQPPVKASLPANVTPAGQTGLYTLSSGKSQDKPSGDG
jgi:hypothetical protein